MAEKDKYADEIISDEELDGVAGGTIEDSVQVAIFLKRAGFDNMLKNHGLEANYSAMRDALQTLGITAHDHGGLRCLWGTENSYTVNATGEKLNQEGMMNFLRKKFPNVK